MVRRSIISKSLEDTFEAATAFARTLSPDAVVCFFGDLGAGKTTFIKTVISNLCQIPPHLITSPTFNYCQSYAGSGHGNSSKYEQVHHFDLYRLESPEAFLALGFDEYFHNGICLIEWSERIASIVPANSLLVKIEVTGLDSRQIFYETYSISERHLSYISS